MAWTALYALHPQIPGPRTNGDAVVAGLHAAADDGYSGGRLHVNSVGVGALIWSNHLHAANRHIVAPIDHKVTKLAVDRRQAFNDDVVGPIEYYRLH